MNTIEKIAVCSRSFSKNQVLRRELLDRYKNVTFNDDGLQLQGDTLIKFLKGHQKAISALEIIDDYVLSQLPELNVISKYGVGTDMIDMIAMGKYGIKFGWTGGVNKRSVSELVISFAIALLRHVPASHREVLSGTWRQHIGSNLSGKTVGVIGCGHIGKDLIKLLQPFECSILVNDICKYEDFYNKYVDIWLNVDGVSGFNGYTEGLNGNDSSSPITFHIDIGEINEDSNNNEVYDFGEPFVDENGDKKTPIILHNSPSGAIERCLYALLEKAAKMQREGKIPSIPFWLCPTQIRIIPLSQDFHDVSLGYLEELSSSGFRVDFDDRDLSVGKKVREAEKEWLPFILVIGKNEVENKNFQRP